MKKLLSAAFFISFSVMLFAQSNVGIGTNSPLTKLDVNGALSVREGSTLTLSNGANNNVVLPNLPSTTDVAGFYRVTGPTASFSITGITPVSGANGQTLTLVNATGQQMTIVYNSSSSTSANRIFTQAGTNLVDNASSNVYTSVTLVYSKNINGGTGGWLVNATQNYTLPADFITGTLASSNLPALSGDVTGSVTSNTVGKIQGVSVSATAPSSNQVMEYNGSSWVPASLPASLPPNGTASGDLSGSYPSPTVSGIAGKSISGTAVSGDVLEYNGSNWVYAAPSNGSVTSVGLSLPSIFSVSGSPVTSTGTLTGTLASESASTFLAAPTSASGTPTFRPITATDVPTLNQNTTGSAAGFTGSLSGDVTGTQSATVVGKINGSPLGATTGAATGNVLKWNGSAWAVGADANSGGTVTSVALSLPSIFTVSGSPVTTSGTLSGTLATESANTVLAGPSTGSAAAPTFRALTATDIPTLNQNTTGSAGSFTGALAGDVTGTQSATVVGKINGSPLGTTTGAASGNVLKWNGSAWAAGADANSGGTVTSVSGSGGTTGLTLSGGPITASGTLTLGGTLGVANGGTGDGSLTAYSVLCGGTTATGALQSVSSVGTSGQVLTSNGAGALPTWQNPASGGSSASHTNFNQMIIPSGSGYFNGAPSGTTFAAWALINYDEGYYPSYIVSSPSTGVIAETVPECATYTAATSETINSIQGWITQETTSSSCSVNLYVYRYTAANASNSTLTGTLVGSQSLTLTKENYNYSFNLTLSTTSMSANDVLVFWLEPTNSAAQGGTFYVSGVITTTP